MLRYSGILNQFGIYTFQILYFRKVDPHIYTQPFLIKFISSKTSFTVGLCTNIP